MKQSSLRNVLWGDSCFYHNERGDFMPRVIKWEFRGKDSSRKGHDCNLKLFLIVPCIKKKFLEQILFTAGKFGRCSALNDPPGLV